MLDVIKLIEAMTDYKNDLGINQRAFVFIGLLSLLLVFIIIGELLLFVNSAQEKNMGDYRDNIMAIMELKADQLASWRYERLKDINNISKNITEEPFLSYALIPSNYVYKDLVDMKFSSLFTDNIFTDIIILDGDYSLIGVVKTKYEIYTQLIETYKNSPKLDLDYPSIVDLSKEVDGSVHMAVAYHSLLNGKPFHILFIINPEVQLYNLLSKVPSTLKNINVSPELFKVFHDKVVVLTNTNMVTSSFTTLSDTDNVETPIIKTAKYILNENITYSIKDMVDASGNKVLVAFNSVKSSPWYISVTIPKDKGYADIVKQGFMNKLVLVVILILWFFGLLLLIGKYRLVVLYDKSKKLEQYRVLVESSPDIMYERSSIHGYTFYSPIIQKVLGYSPEQLLKKNFSFLSLIHMDDTKLVSDAYISALDTTNLNIEYRVKNISGEWRWIADRSISISLGDSDGEFIIKGIMTDITDRKQIENILKLASSTFVNAIEAMVITNSTGVVLEINDAFTRITGYSRGEVKGKNINILKSGLQSVEFYQNMFSTLATKGYWHGELWNKRKDGRLYLEDLAITALRDTSGEISSYVGLFFSKAFE